MHDADTILNFLVNTEKSTKTTTKSIIKFAQRGLFLSKCSQILSKIKPDFVVDDVVHGSYSDLEPVRVVCITTLANLNVDSDKICQIGWIHSHDANSDIKKASLQILQNSKNAFVPKIDVDSLALLTHSNSAIRINAAAACAHSLTSDGVNLAKSLERLVDLYVENVPDEKVAKPEPVVEKKPKVVKRTVKKVVKKTTNIGGEATVIHVDCFVHVCIHCNS